MRRPKSSPWRASCWPFVLIFLLACPPARAQATSSQRIERLDSEAAAKLLIHVTRPAYPAVAKVNFIQGAVQLEITVTPAGRVSEVHVIDGQPILAVAALDAVDDWLYRPYILRGSPAPFSTDVIVQFNLHSRRYRGQLPRDADGYLEKQVRPPEVITRPQDTPPPSGLRMKVLVGPKGEVLDASPLEPTMGSAAELARKNLQFWKFSPARWGSIAVPWYITVRVQPRGLAMDQAVNAAKH
ncbi:MAG TPA: energy transducer TonB [Terriglobia bacterium]|nr:energy transducer TonB [Terriglobia bacterium]